MHAFQLAPTPNKPGHDPLSISPHDGRQPVKGCLTESAVWKNTTQREVLLSRSTLKVTLLHSGSSQILQFNLSLVQPDR